MRKHILFVLVLCAALFPLAALEGYEGQTFHVENAKKHATIDMTYTESTQNLLVVYKIKYLPFDEGDALVMIRDAVLRFADEHGFKHYRAYSKDIIKYHDKETELIRFIVLYN